MDLPLSSNNEIAPAADLRTEAELRFRVLNDVRQLDSIDHLDTNDIQQLLHELRVHQIELEMQNEELLRNQAELEDSRARYFNLFDLAPVAYFTLNQQGLILEANLASANLFGLKCCGEFYQTPITRYILKEDQDIFYLNSRKVTPHSPGAWEIRMVNLKGKPIWVQLNASAEYNHTQRTHVFHISITDISEIKHHQQQLRLSDAALKSISQGVVMTTPDMAILSVNQSFTEITGYTLAEVIGRNCRFLQGPATDPKMIEVMGAKIAHGEEFGGEILNYRKDHTPFWNDLSITPLRNEDGVITHFMSILRDVTARIEIAQQLKEQAIVLELSERLSLSITENMFDGVITLNAQGHVISYNKAAMQMFGYTAEEVTGQYVSILLPECDRAAHDKYLSHIKEASAELLGIPYVLSGQTKTGTIFPICVSMTQIGSADQSIFIALIRDISQQLRNENEIRLLAFYDPLTKLPNRRLLLDRLEHAMRSSIRTGRHGALMFLDLDHFKNLNDSLGHDIGDELLQQVAARLQCCIRDGDSVARLGGDEFVLLIEELNCDAQRAGIEAEVIVNKILVHLDEPYSLQGHHYTITPSIGIVLFMKDHESMAELLKTADVAMYQAKSAGRNTSRFFNLEMQDAANTRAKLEQAIRTGLSANEFFLHYQPQVNSDQHIIGVEALIRWQHPEYGIMNPVDFIPLAEETGLILPMGQQVLEAACTQLETWSHNQITSTWTLAVNVSALEFAQNDFVANVVHALTSTGANPRRLKLELTESMLLNKIDEVIVKMNTLKQLGVVFSLDDFGTGYSSLNYLKQLPLSQLKIDQSFVQELLTDPHDASIANTIITLGHSLGLHVIAEGVESVTQYEYLLKCGCDEFQGFYFGRPANAESVVVAH